MKTLSIDLETYSEADIASCGIHKYAEDSSFSILLFGYSEDYGEPIVIDLASGEEIPKRVLDALQDPAVTKTAYNAPFERAAIKAGLGVECPPEQWECTMVLAAQAGLPFGLDAVSKAMRLPEDKAKLSEGKRLIRYFCMPCRPTKANGGRTRNLPEHDPEKWQRFKEYCARDVESENYIRQTLLKYRPDATEQRFWVLDQKINDAGVRVDMQLVEKAIALDERNKAALTERAIKLTGIENPNSVSQVKRWLEDAEGIEIESLNKKAMPEVMERITDERARDFLELRSELSKTSVSKYEAIRRSVCKDGHVRGLFQFYGANRTGRFAGRLLQVQNLPQNHLPDLKAARSLVRAGQFEVVEMLYDSVSSTLSELIRTALLPEPSCKLIVADFSAIEARVVAWYAKEKWALEEFEGEGKIYEATASRMFGVPKEKIVKGNPEYELRQKGKVATLALGYQGGVNALIAMGALRGGLTEEELPEIVKRWRNANKNIVRWWYSLDNAAHDALQGGIATDDVGGITFRFAGGHLFMDLPSGRSLCYYRARVGTNRFGGKSIQYESLNQVTRRWEVTDIYGGKFAENCVQATARDCLREAMLRLDAEGYDIRMHVHDEVVINEPIGGRSAEEVCAIMGLPIPWAKGLPLRADGYETPFYRKD